MLAQIISNILHNREIAENEFRPLVEEIDDWENIVKSIESFQSKEGWTKLLKSQNRVSEWAAILTATSELKTELKKLHSSECSFYKAWSRASRKWLNLGAIGTWRQGKSEFISKLTGLDEWLIPRHDSNDACTGTTVNIINSKLERDGKLVSDVARVYYYDVKGIVDLFNEYFCTLGIKYNCNATTKDELLQYVINNSDDIKNEPVNNTRLFNKLLEYFEHTEYINLLQDNSDSAVPYEDIDGIRNDIQKKRDLYPLISYYETPTTPNNIRTYKVLAVKSVDIYTSYYVLGEDVGKIQIYDTPGLGEEKIGVDDALIKALRFDLDIAVVLRKARNNDPFGNDDSKLNSILKTELNTRKAKDEWLYFLLNYYSGTPTGTVCQLRDQIISDLKINLGNNATPETNDNDNSTGKQILLSKDHFGIVNCKDNKKIILPDNSESVELQDNGVETFVMNMLSNVVHSISIIDDDFYKDARIEYKEISQKFENLRKSLRNLQFPSVFSPEDVVPDDLCLLHQELEKLGNVNITKDINSNLTSFADENTIGTQLLQLLLHDDYKSYTPVVKEIKDIVARQMKNDYADDDADIESLNYKRDILIVKEIIKRCSNRAVIPTQVYNSFTEFKFYSDWKSDFAAQFKEAISKQFDDQSAKDIVESTKTEIWKVLKKDGRLAFICPNGSEEEWYSCLIKYLSDNNYFELCTKFETLHDFKVDIQNEIEKSKISILRCFHKDDFGTLNFESPENTILSFMYSLYIIESKTKDYLLNNNEVVQELISLCNEHFCNCITDFSQIASMNIIDSSTNNPKLNPCWKQLNKIFTQNFEKIYANDPRRRMQNTINDWNQNVVNHVLRK